jgi:predicted esterase
MTSLSRTMAGATAGALLVLPPAHAGRAAGGRPVEGPFGKGADAVWLIRPSTPIRSVVVFAHGWKSHAAVTTDEWVQQFRPWLDHLAAEGNAIVFPRYQLGHGDSPGTARLNSFRHALEIGFARLGRPRVPVVAAGYSFGGSLVLHYAVNARTWGLPTPAAVDGVFPAGPIPGAPLPPLPATVRVLIQVGENDTEAGSGGAEAFQARLSHHPSSRVQLETVHTSATLYASHAAPKESSRAAQRAFWAPLDYLISTARKA